MQEEIDQHFKQDGTNITCTHDAENHEGITFELPGGVVLSPCQQCLQAIRERICVNIVSKGMNLTLEPNKGFHAAFLRAMADAEVE